MKRYSKIIRAFKRTLAATAALIVGMCLATPTPSQATVTGICGPVHSLDAVGFGDLSDQIGFCTKSVTILGSELTITLTNTSNPLFGGFIVADTFALPTPGIVTFVSSTNSEFDPGNASPGVVLNGAVVAAPFTPPLLNRAIISLGGTLDNAFETFGGDPTLGIGVGESATFVFNLVGAIEAGATEQSIFDSQLIRFSGFDELGAPGDRTSVSPCVDSECQPTLVPEPATFWLLGTALIGGGFWSRRRMIVESVLRGLR